MIKQRTLGIKKTKQNEETHDSFQTQEHTLATLKTGLAIQNRLVYGSPFSVSESDYSGYNSDYSGYSGYDSDYSVLAIQKSAGIGLSVLCE